MNRILLLLFAAFGLLTPSATAQGAKASGKLYTRTEGSDLRFVIAIDIDPDFHLYHHELGAPDAVGMPMSVKLSADNVEFDELVWPEPHRYDQLGIGDGGRDTYILGHEDELVLYGHGRIAAGAEPTLSVKVKGLTCEDDGSCFPYNETLTSSGKGKDGLWSDYPAAAFGMVVESDEATETESSDSGFGIESESGGFGMAGESETQPAALDDSEAQALLYTRKDGERLHLAIVIDINEGWHLYHPELGAPDAIGLPTDIELTGEVEEFQELLWPAPHKYVQAGLGADGGDTFILGHEGRIVIYGQGDLASPSIDPVVKAEITGQTCEDSGVCLQYAASLTSLGEGKADIWKAYPSGSWADALANVPPPIEPEDHSPDGEENEQQEEDDEKNGGLLALILGAIGGGIFALLMPCTYPMIPITISFFTKQAEARGGKVATLAILYGMGIVLIFVVIALSVGSLIMPFATHPVTNLVMGSVFVIFSAALFGVITLNPPQALMSMAGRASTTGGLLGVFLMGMTLVLTSFTCTAPFVGTLLSAAAAEGRSIWEITIGMGVFGLTMAIPFMVLAMIPGKLQAMPSSGEWMNTLKVTLGFVELAAALKFFSNVDLRYDWGFMSREFFLLMWALIFVFAGIYLLGWIKVKGYATSEISPGRMMSAVFFLSFAAYCWHGYRGHNMDSIMTAIIPNYSSAAGGGHSGGGGVDVTKPEKHEVIEDDFEAAKDSAISQSKPVLINFTGFL